MSLSRSGEPSGATDIQVQKIPVDPCDTSIPATGGDNTNVPSGNYSLIQHHSFEYGTRLMRYPDFTPVTTQSLQLNPTRAF